MSEPVSTHIKWHEGLSRKDRFEKLATQGATLWFTGLSGSGKSTVATALEHQLVNLGQHAYRLDGDNLRHGLNNDLGFSPEDRTENIRRVGEVGILLADSGCLVLSSFISPYREDRDKIRNLHQKSGLPFLEIYMDVSVDVCESRDPKGLYKKARAGEIPSFTGISAPYEAPESPELRIQTDQCSVEEAAMQCIAMLKSHHLLAS